MHAGLAGKVEHSITGEADKWLFCSNHSFITLGHLALPTDHKQRANAATFNDGFCTP